MRIIFLSFLLCCLIGGYAISPDYVDSLSAIVKKRYVPERDKIKILLELSYYCQDNPPDAIRYGCEVIDLASEKGMTRELAYAHGYIGMAELRLGNHCEGIEHFIASAEMYRKLGLYREEAYALGSIGTAFQKQFDRGNTLKYYKQCLNLFTNASDTFFVASSLLNIGEAFREFGEVDSAKVYFDEALRHFNLLNNSAQVLRNKALINGNLGLLHLEEGLISEAEQELIEASKFFENDAAVNSIFLSGLGELYFGSGKIEKGLQYLERGFEMATSENLKQQARDISLQLSQLYELSSSYDKSLNYYKFYNLYDDSLKDIATVREMEKMQSKFELKKKEEEIDILSRLNKLQRHLAYFLASGIFVFLVLMSLLVKKNQRISEFNNRLNQQKQLLEKNEKQKSLLLRELNHRVKNNLQMVSSLLNLQARQLRGHPAAEALIAGKCRVEALTLIHQKLYREDVETKIDLKEYVNDLSSNLVMNFGKNFQLNLELDSLLIKIDRAIPLGLIINELITNALKYVGSKQVFPALSIVLKCNNERGIVIIKDNGDGLPDDFDFSKTTSFGIKLVNSLVKQLNGTIEWDNKGGTTWNVSFDIAD